MSVGGLSPTHRTDSCYVSGGQGRCFAPYRVRFKMARTVDGLASKPYLEDEVRQDLNLPQIVRDYEDVFPDELP